MNGPNHDLDIWNQGWQACLRASAPEYAAMKEELTRLRAELAAEREGRDGRAVQALRTAANDARAGWGGCLCSCPDEAATWLDDRADLIEASHDD